MKLSLEHKIVGLVIVILIICAIVIGFIGVTFIRADIRYIVDTYSGSTINFIKYAIEETLVTGDPGVTKDLIRKKRNSPGLENITVYNDKGQEAFSKFKRRVRSEEASIFGTLNSTGSSFRQETEDSIDYYMPLKNTDRCIGCHDKQNSVLGIVKVSMFIKDAKERILYRTRIIIFSLLFSIIFLGTGLWIIFKRVVINPVKDLERATKSLSSGNLSFRTDIHSKDEIGLLNKHLKSSIRDVSAIIKRAFIVSEKVGKITHEVGTESKKIVEGTRLEAEASDNIHTSVKELDNSIGEITENIDALSSSSEQITVAVDEMVTNNDQITQNTVELFGAVDSGSSSIEEMSISIQEIAGRTKELTISAEETLTAIEEINSTVKEIESETKEAALLSEKVTSDASTFGMDAIRKTREGMERIKAKVQKTAEFIEKLSNRSEEIGKILNVIDEITDQTTLLSLNAAILAAQAGEHGKGFSVVADEIKDLAERTAFSTQEIGTLITSVQTEVKGAVVAMTEGLKTIDEGNSLSSEAEGALEKIIESSKKSTSMVSSVQVATSEQTKGIKFITDAMDRVKEMVKQISKAVFEQASGVDNIMSESEKIKGTSAQVKNANLEQSKAGKQVYKALEHTNFKIHSIAGALKEQKSGSGEIVNSLVRIKYLFEQNKNWASLINNKLVRLQKDAELLITELGRFKVESAREKTEVITFGVIPLESPAEMYKRFIPLTKYLSKKMNKKVELHMSVDFEETIKNIGEGIFDFCYMTPSTYIEARNKYDVQVIASALNEGKPFHYSVIVTREGSNIKDVEDIKGCSFAFGDKHSTSSYIVPRAVLNEAGIDLDDLGFYAYLGHHDEVARAVLNGEFDAGGIMESTAEKFKEQGLISIKRSFEIPEFNICVNRSVSEKDKKLIKQYFLELSENSARHRAILQSINPAYSGFIQAHDSDYDGIRDIMQRIKLEKV